MKKLIISLAVNGRENYVEKQKKLIETLPIAKDCDYWILNEYPDFKAARHDQTAMSFLFHFYQIPLLPYGVIAAKPHVTEETYIQYAD